MRTTGAFVLLWVLSACLLCVSSASHGTRYLLYTVKYGEGFNLRRDVHMRAVTLLRRLQEEGVGGTRDWVLVLPPWPKLHHWRSKNHAPFQPWGNFFDLPSLNQFVPSIEFDDYIRRNGRAIDEVMVLQNFEGEFTVDDFGKIKEHRCLSEQHLYRRVSEGWKGRVFGVEDISILNHRCISAMGHISLILPHLRQLMGNSVLVENFEILLHENFGDANYWYARYSMVYATHLQEAGNKFMRETLGYHPNEGGMGRELAKEGGGKYISVHLRRQDYLYAHKDAVPSLEGVASQLNTLKRELELETIFLASDASTDEKEALKRMVEGLVWFTPSDEEKRNYGDGGVAIIDQWVAAHARHFLGTTHSTFSFRIHEDRQFLGFSRESTFNHVCGPSDNEHDPHSCKKPSYWKWEGGPPTPLNFGPPAGNSADREEL